MVKYFDLDPDFGIDGGGRLSFVVVAAIKRTISAQTGQADKI